MAGEMVYGYRRLLSSLTTGVRFLAGGFTSNVSLDSLYLIFRQGFLLIG